jgi:superoxide reductase
MKLYRCNHCGNIVSKLNDSGVPVVCCGEPMEEINPNTTDAAQEKHVPVIQIDGREVTVNVGSVDHPMMDEHYITFIILETRQGRQRKELKPGSAPQAKFTITEDDEVLAAYEYCNLHGFWKAEV